MISLSFVDIMNLTNLTLSGLYLYNIIKMLLEED